MLDGEYVSVKELSDHLGNIGKGGVWKSLRKFGIVPHHREKINGKNVQMFAVSDIKKIPRFSMTLNNEKIEDKFLTLKQISELLNLVDVRTIRKKLNEYQIPYFKGSSRVRYYVFEEVFRIPVFAERYSKMAYAPRLHKALEKKPEDLKKGEFIVLFCLIFHKVTFDAWPSIQKIEQMCKNGFNYNQLTISTYLSVLVQKGYITDKDFKYSTDFRNTYRRYKVTLKGANTLDGLCYKEVKCPDCECTFLVKRDFVVDSLSIDSNRLDSHLKNYLQSFNP